MSSTNPSYDPLFAISEQEAFTASKENAITKLRLVRQGRETMVFLHLNWRKGEFFVATKRNKQEPRRFKNAERLFEYLESNFPSIHKLSIALSFDEAPAAPPEEASS